MGPSGTKKLIAVGISGAVAVSLLLVAAWMVFGDANGREPDGIQIIAPAEGSEPDAVGSPSFTPPVETQTEVMPPQPITVYITGEVVNPGVYTIAEGERLNAALRLAGGATENADLSRVNLAAYATDAAHYRIPATGGEPVGAAEPLGDGSAPNPDAVGAPESCQPPVNINTASAQCLETLPGIGGVRAESIVAHREQEGPFASPQAITDVSGIGDGIFRRLAELITVDPH